MRTSRVVWRLITLAVALTTMVMLAACGAPEPVPDVVGDWQMVEVTDLATLAMPADGDPPAVLSLSVDGDFRFASFQIREPLDGPLHPRTWAGTWRKSSEKSDSIEVQFDSGGREAWDVIELSADSMVLRRQSTPGVIGGLADGWTARFARLVE